jgi:hypothetical protein
MIYIYIIQGSTIPLPFVAVHKMGREWVLFILFEHVHCVKLYTGI